MMRKLQRRERDPRRTKRSLRSLAIALAAVVLCVAVNIAVSFIPSRYTKIDTSVDSYLTLSEQSQQILSSLETDITLYWLVTTGSENETLGLLLERYADESSHIRVEKIDLTLNPEFGQQYTTKTIFENSVIVDGGDKSEYVSYYRIYNYDDSDYLSTGSFTITFEGENRLTNAIHYVSSDSVPTVYQLIGHGESELGDAFETALADENLVLQELNLLTASAVPDDCACLLVCNPTTDLSAEDTEKVRTYLDAGGTMLLLTNNVEEDALPNLRGLIREDYGIDVTGGIVLEAAADYYVAYPYYLLPEIHSHTITDPLINSGYFAIVPFAQPMVMYGTPPSGVTITSLLTTTDESYARADGFDLGTLTREDDDLAGPFTVGAAIESTARTKIVWIPSYYILNETVDEQVSGGNTNLLLNALSWMCDQPEAISIRARLVAEDYFTVSAGVARNFSLGLIGLIPITFLAVGGVVWMRRRRR